MVASSAARLPARAQSLASKHRVGTGRALSDDAALQRLAAHPAAGAASRQRCAGLTRRDAAATAMRLPARAQSLVSNAGTDWARSDDAAVEGFARQNRAPVRPGVVHREMKQRLAAESLLALLAPSDRAETADFVMSARVRIDRVGFVSTPPDRTARAPIGGAATADVASSTLAGTGRTARRFVHQRLEAVVPSPREAATTLL